MATKAGRAFEADGLEPGEMAHANAFVAGRRCPYSGGNCDAARGRRTDCCELDPSAGKGILDYTKELAAITPLKNTTGRTAGPAADDAEQRNRGKTTA